MQVELLASRALHGRVRNAGVTNWTGVGVGVGGPKETGEEGREKESRGFIISIYLKMERSSSRIISWALGKVRPCGS